MQTDDTKVRMTEALEDLEAHGGELGVAVQKEYNCLPDGVTFDFQ